MYKITVKDHNGKLVDVEVSREIFEFDKQNYWQEDWRNRKRKKENSLDESSEKFSLSHILSKELTESAEKSYIKKFEKEKLHEAIKKLPEIQRRRIILRFFHNLTIPQIAEIENCGEIRIKKTILVALESLKTFLKE